MNLNSVIMTKVRPTVIFRAEDAEHRRYAWHLIKSRSLKDCPYIWALTSGHDNVYDMLMHELSKYYTEREFAGTVNNVVPLNSERSA
jgi:hypothetical protein